MSLVRCWLSFALIVIAAGFSAAACAAPYIELPDSGLEPKQLAVIYLEGDALSEQVARYYLARRGIPLDNLVSIKFDTSKKSINPGQFAVAFRALEAKLPAGIQAFALTWTSPYRVGCMAISAAFALGYNTQYCADSCELTRTTPYYHSSSTKPYDNFGIRPTMLLAAESFEQAKALIDRGLQADNSMPRGKLVLLKTSDKVRTVREQYYPDIQREFGALFDVEIREQDAIKGQRDILFYFTGSKWVKHLDTLEFLPGAMADHMTSAGGALTGSSQMSVLRWLEAGATASYGTAIEPCNFPQKFPNPVLAVWHYLSGASIVEAYWKSVQMPGQGNFVGEPLAAPFRGYRLSNVDGKLRVYSPVLRQGRYALYSEDFGIEHSWGTQLVSRGRNFIELEPPYSSRYRIERLH